MSTLSLSDKIRPLKLQQEARHGRQPYAGRALLALDVREAFERLLEPYLSALRDELPQLWPRRRLYDGAWVLGLEADLPHGSFKGSPYKAFNRLEFALSMDTENGEYALICSCTVFDTDLPTEDMSGPMGGRLLDQREALESFVEGCCLRFAECFFEQSSELPEAPNTPPDKQLSRSVSRAH